MSERPFQRIAIIGLGLIGASIARAIRAHDLADEITGHDRTPDVRARAEAIGLADRIVAGAEAAVANADLVFLCVPVGACGEVAAEIGPHLKSGAIVTDVGRELARATDRGRGWPYVLQTFH